MAGRSKVRVDDGLGRQQVFRLDKPNTGIYIPRMVWKDMYDFSPDSVLLVLASEHYDGSEYLRILDPETFRVQRSVPVTFRGAPVQLLNELEWIDGKIWANVYVTDQIVIIDPASGIVEGVIDLRGLLPDEEIAPDTDVLNGIAYDAASERIFVTGKRWSKLFEIEIIPQ